jgi:hypothetical protein
MKEKKRAIKFESIQKRHEVNKSLQQELAQVNADILALQRKADKQPNQIAHLEGLKAKKEALKTRLEKLASSTEKTLLDIQKLLDTDDWEAVTKVLNAQSLEVDRLLGVAQASLTGAQAQVDRFANTPFKKARDAVVELINNLDPDNAKELDLRGVNVDLTDFEAQKKQYLDQPTDPAKAKDFLRYLNRLYNGLEPDAAKEAANLAKAEAKRDVQQKRVDDIQEIQQALKRDRAFAKKAKENTPSSLASGLRYLFAALAAILILTFTPLVIATTVGAMLGAAMIALGILFLATALFIGNKAFLSGTRKRVIARIALIAIVALGLTALAIVIAFSASTIVVPGLVALIGLITFTASLLGPAAYYGANNRTVMGLITLTTLVTAGIVLSLGLPGFAVISFASSPALAVGLAGLFLLSVVFAVLTYKAKPDSAQPLAEPNPDLDQEEAEEIQATPHLTVTGVIPDPKPITKPNLTAALAAVNVRSPAMVTPPLSPVHALGSPSGPPVTPSSGVPHHVGGGVHSSPVVSPVAGLSPVAPGMLYTPTSPPPVYGAPTPGGMSAGYNPGAGVVSSPVGMPPSAVHGTPRAFPRPMSTLIPPPIPAYSARTPGGMGPPPVSPVPTPTPQVPDYFPRHTSVVESKGESVRLASWPGQGQGQPPITTPTSELQRR